MSGMFRICSALTTIYAGEGWNADAVTESSYMFASCINLVGGAGTTYDANHTDQTYAHIDGGTANPGYFTDKNAPAMEIAAPKFSFSGNDLVMSSETEGAMIYYRMQGYNSSAQADSLRNSMTVDTQNTLYQGPVAVTQNVVVKAIAFLQGQGMSEVTTMVYDYDAWRTLLNVIMYADNVLVKANGVQMPNDSLQQALNERMSELNVAINVAYSNYQDRAMWEGSGPYNYIYSIAQMAQEIENMLNYTVPAIAEAYAVLSEDNTVLTFYYDDKKVARGGMSVGPFGDYPDREWNSHSTEVKRVVFTESFVEYRPTGTNHWFYDMNNLTTIQGIHYLRTDNVTSMQSMFHFCYNLRDLDVSGFNTENVTDMWGVFEGCRSLTTLDVSNFNTAKAVSMESMFRDCASLTNLDLSSFNTGNVTNFYAMFRGCSSLACIQAGYASIPQDVYAEIGNPNLLVYVNQESLAPQSVQNVVVNGTAKNIVLTDTEEGNNNFYCPVAFTAENIEYTHEYKMRTEIGVSRGWETIALPFTVQTIRHEKNGLLAPFGSGQEGKPFWLRTLTSNGLTAAHGIEANVPYLISMPNNAVYPADYNQAGRVTFSAQNTVVPVTQPKEASNGDRILVPTFMSVYPTADIYAVNRNAAFETNPEGSVFVAAYRQVRPFEAYALHPNGNARLLSIDELMEGNADFVDILQTETAEEVSVYDLSGKLVGKGRIADIAKRLPHGIYIVNGKKVVIK